MNNRHKKISSAMQPVDSPDQGFWRAQLALEFERRGARSVLAARRHDGPLVVQKALYPEGDQVCHAIVVHPPGGIVGGDELEVGIHTGSGAHALLTTPGAAKWYRSAGSWARQQNEFYIDAGASLEWLPQETIVFDGALAQLRTEVDVAGDGCFIGWEVFCFGRTGSGELFTKGEWGARTSIRRDGKPLWLERMQLEGGGEILRSPAVMAGQPVCGTLLAASPRVDPALLVLCREARPMTGMGGVTAVAGLFVGRYLGASSEAAKNYFIRLWRVLRPALIERTASEPRIWQT